MSTENETLHDGVRKFMVAMDQEVVDRPTFPTNEILHLRLKLVTEEFLELLEACNVTDLFTSNGVHVRDIIHARIAEAEAPDMDMVEAADAMADIDYVVEGFRAAIGIDGRPIAALVQAANMAKVGGPVREDGKRLKPLGWKPADIGAELQRQLGEG